MRINKEKNKSKKVSKRLVLKLKLKHFFFCFFQFIRPTHEKEGCSDDSRPIGTSGRPTLSCLELILSGRSYTYR